MGSERAIRTAVVLNDTSGHRHHGCALVMESIFDLAGRHGLRITETAPVGADWRKLPRVVAAMEQADLLIVNGEGTIHHDAPRGETLLLAGAFARERGKPSALINMTWEANSDRLVDMAKRFDLVSVREPRSARDLTSAGVASRVVPDLALGSIPAIETETIRTGLVFSDNVLADRTLAQYAAMARLGGRPISLGHGLGGARDFGGSVRRYLRAGGGVVASVRAAVCDIRSQNPDRAAFLEHLSSRRLVVTGRFHMMIMCLATATPFLALASNTHKIEGVIEDVGLPGWRMPGIEALDGGLLEKASEWQPGELDKVRDYVARARDQRQVLFEDLARLAQGQRPSASMIGVGEA